MSNQWKQLHYRDKIINNYLINIDGDIKSIEKNNILKCYISKSGYKYIVVRFNGKSKIIYQHLAIASTFIKNFKNHKSVNHKNGNKLKNCISNLKWCDHSYSAKHAIEIGLVDVNDRIGSNHKSSKLIEEDIIYIKNNYKPKNKEFGCRALAKKFGVHHSRISRIVNNISYTNVL